VTHTTRWIALGVAVVLVAFGVVLGLNVSSSPSTEGRLAGRPAPDFALQDLDGNEVTLAGLSGEGRNVLVNFWNSWCLPCEQEHPALVEFYARHREDPDFAMVGIVRDDTEADARRYVADEGVGWTILLDPKHRAALDYGTTGQPETFMIAPEGVVVAEQFGPVTVEDLDLMLRHARGQV
jgi:cytochrome c biogenesis protein CcmG/thiol:disulfide interchange protein DsbE